MTSVPSQNFKASQTVHGSDNITTRSFGIQSRCYDQVHTPSLNFLPKSNCVSPTFFYKLWLPADGKSFGHWQIKQGKSETLTVCLGSSCPWALQQDRLCRPIRQRLWFVGTPWRRTRLLVPMTSVAASIWELGFLTEKKESTPVKTWDNKFEFRWDKSAKRYGTNLTMDG